MILIVFTVLFLVSSAYKNYKIISEANKIVEIIVKEERVDEHVLETIMNKDYDDIKNELGIDHQFLVHFEDKNGEPIMINGMYYLGYDEIS